MSSSRRTFLRTGAAAGAAITTGGMLKGTTACAADTPIRHRELGSTGWTVSEVGFGAMNTRDEELLHAAIDSGINYIDTAHGYMNGENEEVVGRVIKNMRDKVFVTTKLSTRGGGADRLTEMMETSLRRLQVDCVDCILIHGAGSRQQVLDSEMMDIFSSFKDKGYARFVGLSTHSNHAEVIDAARESEFWDMVTVGYNYQSPQEVTEAIKNARKAGLAMVAMKTQLKGAGKPGGANTANQDALAWVLQNDAIDTTIPGIDAFEQLAEDVAVMGMQLSSLNERNLRRFAETSTDSYCCGVSGCTGCKDQCPNGVAVNEINRCLGYAYGYGDIALAKANYDALPSNAKLDTCADCGECTVRCVNDLNLNDQIKRARTLFA